MPAFSPGENKRTKGNRGQSAIPPQKALPCSPSASCHSSHHNTIFIGHTDAQSFNAETPPERFLKLGANCICVHLHDDAERRLGIERDLLAVYTTDCNNNRR